MERFWKAALSVAGIGAIGFFVFWSLYKQWLTLPIFPQLTQDQAFQLLRYFLIFTFGAAVLGVGAYLFTHSRSRSSYTGDVPRQTNTLRLPNGSRFTDAQFDTYRGVWVALQELRQAGDALWSEASQENMDAFVKALRVAKAQAAAGGIFFHYKDYKQLMSLLEHFANYEVGKRRLIELKTRREGGNRWDSWMQEDAERQIQKNRQHLEGYTALLDQIRRTYHDRLSWEHQVA